MALIFDGLFIKMPILLGKTVIKPYIVYHTSSYPYIFRFALFLLSLSCFLYLQNCIDEDGNTVPACEIIDLKISHSIHALILCFFGKFSYFISVVVICLSLSHFFFSFFPFIIAFGEVGRMEIIMR